ncbi:MAG: zinc ribbon domain-containing protein, partial [Gemmatimonadota bacterium]|nr:zinc ribbon domain-containing protein [Gemmatimonadota bacterium]
MPIYEYHCAKCASDFELLVRGETVIACPDCESRKVERLMSRPARPTGGNGG